MTVLCLSLGVSCVQWLSLLYSHYWKVRCRCAFPARLTPSSAHLPAGHHCPFGKAPHTHPLQELHDDERAQRQSGGQLHDHYDRHALSREEEHWCTRYFSLSLGGEVELRGPGGSAPLLWCSHTPSEVNTPQGPWLGLLCQCYQQPMWDPVSDEWPCLPISEGLMIERRESSPALAQFLWLVRSGYLRAILRSGPGLSPMVAPGCLPRGWTLLKCFPGWLQSQLGSCKSQINILDVDIPPKRKTSHSWCVPRSTKSLNAVKLLWFITNTYFVVLHACGSWYLLWLWLACDILA